MRTRRRIGQGVYQDAAGLEVRVQYNGRVSRKRFPLGSPAKLVQGWRTEQLAALKRMDPAMRRGTIGADARTYLGLSRVQQMPSYPARRRDVEAWVEALGAETPRWRVTVTDADTILQRWQDEGLAPGTLNIRRTALVSWWTALDGASADNPMRRVRRFAPPRPIDRSIPPDVLADILGKLPLPYSPSSARILVMAHTGMPPSTIQRLTGAMIHLDRAPYGWVDLPARQKGAGAMARSIPLLSEDAKSAVALLVRLEALGPFCRRALRTTFKEAAKKAGHPAVRLYDLRHTFAAQTFARTQNPEVVAHLLQHASPSDITRRYMMGGVPQVLQEWAEKLADVTL